MVGGSLECAVMMRALSDPAPADSRHSPEAGPRWVWGLSGRRILVAALLGVALGLGASASNAWPSALMYVLNAGWAWAGLMVAGGLCARVPLGGMVTALVSASFANATYYLGDSWWAGASRSGVVIERESFMSALPGVVRFAQRGRGGIERCGGTVQLCRRGDGASCAVAAPVLAVVVRPVDDALMPGRELTADLLHVVGGRGQFSERLCCKNREA